VTKKQPTGFAIRKNQWDATTSCLNSHLKSQHHMAHERFIKKKLRLEREAAGAKRAIDEWYNNLEGKWIKMRQNYFTLFYYKREYYRQFIATDIIQSDLIWKVSIILVVEQLIT
jgi:hypothetical protein